MQKKTKNKERVKKNRINSSRKCARNLNNFYIYFRKCLIPIYFHLLCFIRNVKCYAPHANSI